MEQLLRCICKRKRLLIFIILLTVSTATWIIWRSWRFSGQQMVQSAIIVERSSWYEIMLNGKPMLYFSDIRGDSVLEGLSVHRDSSIILHRSTGFWIDRWWFIPSCRGRLITAFSNTEKNSIININLQLVHEKTRLNQLMHGLRLQNVELKYFLHAHGVQDEGYAMIANFANKIAGKLHDTRSLITLIDSITTGKTTLSLHHKNIFQIIYHDEQGHPIRQICTANNVSADGKCFLLQTQNKKTPATACPLNRLPWLFYSDGEVLATGFGGLQEPLFSSFSTHATIVPANKTGNVCDISPILAGDGSPLFTTHGWFISCLLDGNIVDRIILSDLFNNEKLL